MDPRLDLFGLPLGRVEALILKELVKAYPSGRYIRIEDMAAIVYSHDKDGGPDHALTCIKVTVVKLRKKIERLGWTITKYEYRLDRVGGRY